MSKISIKLIMIGDIEKIIDFDLIQKHSSKFLPLKNLIEYVIYLFQTKIIGI